MRSGVGGLTLLRNGSRSTVKVYPVTGISMTDYWGDTTETSGTVTMDKLQKVFLSQTQTSAQVYVTEGQTVKKGDRLLSYDSTLTELDVERARIALERLRLQQENTRKELQQLQLAEDKEKLQQQADALTAQIEKEAGGIHRRDHPPGFQAHPARQAPCCVAALPARRRTPFTVIGTAATPDGAEPVGAAAGRGERTVCGAGDPPGRRDAGGHHRQLGAAPDPWGGRHHRRVSGGPPGGRGYLCGRHHRRDSPASQGAGAGAEPVEPVLHQGRKLLRMQNDKLREIQEADTSIKMAELDLRRKQAEASDSSVYSQLDGVVKAVRTPTDVAANNEAVVEVSAGGGYYVTGTVSESAAGHREGGPDGEYPLMDDRDCLHRRGGGDQYPSHRRRFPWG